MEDWILAAAGAHQFLVPDSVPGPRHDQSPPPVVLRFHQEEKQFDPCLAVPLRSVLLFTRQQATTLGGPSYVT